MTNMFKKLSYIFLMMLFIHITGHAQLKKLIISENKRYFQDESGKPFFWLGDTGWLLFVKLDRAEAERYLEDRKQKGFNVIQVMVVHSVGVANVYGDSALTNRNVSTPKVTPGNAPTDQDAYDYWDHVDYIINLAEQKGLYMALVPVWGTNVKNGYVSRSEARTYAQWLADRYKNKSNIIWLNGGDVKGSDSLATWNLMGETINAADPNHLITFHPFGRTTSSQWFHNESWLDFNMFQSGHRSYDLDTSRSEHRFGPDNFRFVEMDFSKRPLKPTIDGEPSYELIPYGLHDTTKPYWNANDVRRYAYWSVFAGSAGHTYGHNSVMQMHKPTDKGSAYGSKKYWYDAINDSGAQQMVHLKNLMLSKSYFDRVPDQSLISGRNGEKYNYVLATRGKDYVLVYTYTGGNFSVNMGSIKAGNVKAAWFNPKDGSRTNIGKIKNKGIKEFNPPGEPAEGNDWVLILEK
jgi:hypothetical protein